MCQHIIFFCFLLYVNHMKFDIKFFYTNHFILRILTYKKNCKLIRWHFSLVTFFLTTRYFNYLGGYSRGLKSDFLELDSQVTKHSISYLWMKEDKQRPIFDQQTRMAWNCFHILHRCVTMRVSQLNTDLCLSDLLSKCRLVCMVITYMADKF